MHTSSATRFEIVITVYKYYICSSNIIDNTINVVKVKVSAQQLAERRTAEVLASRQRMKGALQRPAAAGVGAGGARATAAPAAEEAQAAQAAESVKCAVCKAIALNSFWASVQTASPATITSAQVEAQARFTAVRSRKAWLSLGVHPGPPR